MPAPPPLQPEKRHAAIALPKVSRFGMRPTRKSCAAAAMPIPIATVSCTPITSHLALQTTVRAPSGIDAGDLRTDAGIQAGDAGSECGQGCDCRERDQTCEQRVLDQVGAAVVCDERVDR